MLLNARQKYCKLVNNIYVKNKRKTFFFFDSVLVETFGLFRRKFVWWQNIIKHFVFYIKKKKCFSFADLSKIHLFLKIVKYNFFIKLKT